MTHNARELESILSELGEDPSFVSTGGRAIVTFPSNQSFPLDDPAVKPWLKNGCLKHSGFLPSNSALSDAVEILRVRARMSGSLRPIAFRIGADDAGSIFLDLANERNQIAHVTPHGWRLTSFTPSITLVSGRGQLPIPTPDPAAPDASLDPLRPLLNCASEPSWNGIVDWLTAALHPDRPCPVLILHGPPGSGKTTAARLLRTLIDPKYEPLRTLPSRGAAVESYAELHHVLAFDHITRMSGSTADALCRLSSGAMAPSHPIILTVPRLDATDWQPRADLAARAITVHLPAIADPRPPKELEAEFEKLRPKLLSALLTKVSIAPAGIHRPSDAGTTLLQSSARQDPLFKSIHKFMETNEQWTGTATDLFNEICVTASPRALSHRLRILAPALASQAALTVKFHRTDGGIRKITITHSGLSDPPPPATEPPPPLTDQPPQGSGNTTLEMAPPTLENVGASAPNSIRTRANSLPPVSQSVETLTVEIL